MVNNEIIQITYTANQWSRKRGWNYSKTGSLCCYHCE